MLHDIVDKAWPFASWLLFASLKSIGVILIIFGTQKICAQWLSPGFRFGLWFALLACAMVPFGPELSIPMKFGGVEDRSASEAPLSESVGSGIVHDAPKLSWSAERADPIAIASNLSIQVILLATWLGGALFLLAYVARNVARCRRLIAEATDVSDEMLASFDECKTAVRMTKSVRLLESASIETPAVFGVWSPIVVLPHSFMARVRAVELRHVFLHELAHVKRKDILVNWLFTSMQIVHWFNPFMWYALAAMRNDMEKACDADALERLTADERTDYGRTLIKLADFAPRGVMLVHGVSIVQTHSLKSRIAMIAKFKPNKTLYSVVGVVLFSGIAALAVTQPRAASREPVPRILTTAESTTTSTLAVQTPLVANNDNKSPERHAPEAQRAQLVTQRIAAAEQKRSDPLQTEYIKLNYMRAQDLVSLVRHGSGIGLLSRDGSAAFDSRTNIVLIHDTPETLKQIHEMIKALDVPLGQIVIEARIALVSDEFIRDMRARKIGTSSSVAPLNSDFPFAAELAAAEANGKAEVISSPRLITGDRKEAAIEQGIEFKNNSGRLNTVKLRIAMTPQINENDTLLMSVSVQSQSSESAGEQNGKSDLANSKQAVEQAKVGTQILVKDGGTFVLGEIVDGKKALPTTPFDAFGDKHLLIFLTTKIARQEVAKLN